MASEQGDVDSLYNMGVIYEVGDGVERNLDTALDYYKCALEKGHPNASKKIKMIEQAKK
jgi:TPR repeat protein